MPPPVVRAVYQELVSRFGEPDIATTFDHQSASPGSVLQLDRVLVMAWHPGDQLDVTTMATVGMSARPLPGVPFRLELHFSVRGRLDASVQQRAAVWLANMANYPWDHGRVLDWWHVLGNPGPIPAFPNCSAVIFHPRFVSEGWDHVHHDSADAHLLNVVPITSEERALALKSTSSLVEYWEKNDVCLFSDRSTPRR